MKRALRRHHYNRLKSLRKKKLGYWNWHMTKKIEGSYANTACKCSCFMCGNPRRKFKTITRQEHIANIRFIEGCQASEVYCPLHHKQLRKPYR